jgi:dynamin 1-like protein
MEEARKAEQEFFDSHEEYSDVGGQCGTANLAKGLNRILVNHIRGLLPGLRATMEKELDDRAAELIGYGDAPVGDTPAQRCDQDVRES